MTARLGDFFEAMGTYLIEGRGDLDEAAARLGPAPSGWDRVRRYPGFVRAQHVSALEGAFPSTRRALEAMRPGTFLRAIDLHLGRTTFSGKHPSALGATFAESVSLAVGPEAQWAEELADLERVRFEVNSAATFSPAVRWYGHRVARLLSKPEEIPPRAQPEGLVILRTDLGHLKMLGASPGRVAAVGVVTGEMNRGELEALGISEDDIYAAVDELSALGIDNLRLELERKGVDRAS